MNVTHNIYIYDNEVVITFYQLYNRHIKNSGYSLFIYSNPKYNIAIACVTIITFIFLIYLFISKAVKSRYSK